MDESHKEILDFLQKNEWGKHIGLREIAKSTKINHPQKVLNKINQLEKMWYIRKRNDNKGYHIFHDKPIPEFTTIPVYSSLQIGNKWFEESEVKPIKTVKISSDILWIISNEEYFFVKIKGNTVIPKIRSEDLILIKKKERMEGKKHLILHNNKAKIKVLQKIGKQEFFISANASIDTEKPLTITKDIKILGTAEKIITSL